MKIIRVISGQYRGKKLLSKEGKDTRPTLDRVKENVFNIISNKIFEAKVLDLFSGSGGIGIEALSRGASFVVFNDKDQEAIRVISANLKGIPLDDKYLVCSKNWEELIGSSANQGEKFDVIYIDPPFASDYIYECVDKAFEILSKNGIIIVEHDSNIKFEDKIIKQKKYGKIHISILGEEYE